MRIERKGPVADQRIDLADQTLSVGRQHRSVHTGGGATEVWRAGRRQNPGNQR